MSHRLSDRQVVGRASRNIFSRLGCWAPGTKETFELRYIVTGDVVERPMTLILPEEMTWDALRLCVSLLSPQKL